MSNTEPTKSIAERLDDHEGLDRAVCTGVRAALRRHMLLGESVVVSENGRVRVLSPDELRARLRAD